MRKSQSLQTENQIFDKTSREPVNYLAKKLTQAKGEVYNYTSNNKFSALIENYKTVPLWHGCIDLHGLEFGSFKVVGYLGPVFKPNGIRIKKHLWACKCVCGRVERKTNFSINKAMKDKTFQHIQMCEVCLHVSAQRKM